MGVPGGGDWGIGGGGGNSGADWGNGWIDSNGAKSAVQTGVKAVPGLAANYMTMGAYGAYNKTHGGTLLGGANGSPTDSDGGVNGMNGPLGAGNAGGGGGGGGYFSGPQFNNIPGVDMSGGGLIPTTGWQAPWSGFTPQLNPDGSLGGVGLGNQFRQGAGQAMGYLGGLVNGTTETPGSIALKNAMGQNIAGQFGMASSAGPNGRAAALRGAQNNAGALGAQGAVQGSIIAGNERLNAANTMGTLGNAAYGNDVNVANNNAQLQAKHQDLMQHYMQMGLDASKANLQANVDLQKIAQNAAVEQNKNILAGYAAQHNILGGLLGGSGQLAAGLGSIFSGGKDVPVPDLGAAPPGQDSPQTSNGSGGVTDGGAGGGRDGPGSGLVDPNNPNDPGNQRNPNSPYYRGPGFSLAGPSGGYGAGSYGQNSNTSPQYGRIGGYNGFSR